MRNMYNIIIITVFIGPTQQQRNHGIVIFVVVNNFNQQTKFVSNSALCRCYLYHHLYYLNGDYILWGMNGKKNFHFSMFKPFKNGFDFV